MHEQKFLPWEAPNGKERNVLCQALFWPAQHMEALIIEYESRMEKGGT